MENAPFHILWTIFEFVALMSGTWYLILLDSTVIKDLHYSDELQSVLQKGEYFNKQPIGILNTNYDKFVKTNIGLCHQSLV